MRKSVVALLPMKANSERVPRKNFRHLAGKPTVHWILDALLSVPEIEQIVINTDARQELAAVGVVDDKRILLRDRPESLCGDFVSMNLVLADDVAAVDADTYLMTHTTNPLLSEATISRSISTFQDGRPDHDSLFSVNRIQTRFYREDASAINHDPNALIRTQDLEPWFEENSCLYLFDRESFSRTNARIGSRPQMFETPALESVDIDDRDDWFIAEALLQKSAAEGFPGEGES